MGLLDRFRSAPAPAPDVAGEPKGVPVWQLAQMGRSIALVSDPRIAQTQTAAAHPILSVVERFDGFGASLTVRLYAAAAMRAYIPVVDAAIGNRRALEGAVRATSDDDALALFINDFIEEVPVGYLGGRATMHGLNVYLDELASSADELGLGVGEILPTQDMRAVGRLVCPSPLTLTVLDQDRDGLAEIYQSQPVAPTAEGTGETRSLTRIDDRPLVQMLAFRPGRFGASGSSSGGGADYAWPAPMTASCERAGEAMLHIVASVIQGWWRFGDPSLLFTVEGDGGDPSQIVKVKVQGPGDTLVDVPLSLAALQAATNAAMAARKQGRAADVHAYTESGKINQQVIGDIDAALTKYFNEHMRAFAGDIIAASQTPVSMYPAYTRPDGGVGSNRSFVEAALCAKPARQRTARKLRLAYEIVDLHLTLSGRASSVGRYTLTADGVSALDEAVRAEVAEREARTVDTIIGNAAQLYDDRTHERRFQGEAEAYLVEHGVYPS